MKSLKNEGTSHNVCKYFREYNETTPIHGLHYLTDKRTKIERILWVFILLLSLSGCLYMISQIIKKYQNTPVVVTLGTQDTPIHKIPFPTVTVCPESKCSNQLFNYSDIFYKIQDGKNVTEIKRKIFSYVSLICEIDDFNEIENQEKTLNAEDFINVINEVKPSYFIMSCSFLGKDYNCQDIFTPVLTDAGICFSFNGVDKSEIYRGNVVQYNAFSENPKYESNFNEDNGYDKNAGIDAYPRRALMSGADNSFIITFLQYRKDTDFVCNSFFQGFRAIVHSPLDIPRLNKHFFHIPLDKLFVASVEPELITTSEEVKNYNSDKRKCYLSTERPLKYFKIYTYSNCQLKCLTNYTLKRCGCVHYFMPRDNETEICGLGNANCLKSAEDGLRKEIIISKMTEVVDKNEIICDCKPLCTNLKYTAQTSHSDFNLKAYFASRRNQPMITVLEKEEVYAEKEEEIKEKRKFSNVHKYVREYNETTGIQGLHYITGDRSTIEKLVWGIILVLSLIGCFWMVYEIFQKYENSPIVIGFSNKPSFIHQIPFPAITICPNRITSSYKFSYEDINLKLKENTTLTDEERRILYYMRFMCPPPTYLPKREINDTLNSEGLLDFIKEVTPTTPFSSCSFMNKMYNCSNIFTPILTREGICYSFNVMDRSEIFKRQVFHYQNFHQIGRNSSAFDGESGYNGKIGPDIYPKRALIAGTINGLVIHLMHNQNETKEFCDLPLEGYTLRLHHPAEMYETEENIYFLPNEKGSMISITPELIKTSKKIKNYNIEKRKCYLKGEKYLKYFQIYTQSNCDLECLTNVTLSKCGCVDFYMPRIKGTESICGLELKHCMEEAEKYLYKEEIESNEANSSISNYYFGCNCLPSCTELKYKSSKTQVDIRKNNNYWKEEPMLHADDLFVSILFINFDSLSFSNLERNELYGTTDLICNFGALLGLFTGFSFISLAEIIYFLTLRIWCNTRLYGQWSGPPD